jgi:hypothetical protein
MPEPDGEQIAQRETESAGARRRKFVFSHLNLL